VPWPSIEIKGVKFGKTSLAPLALSGLTSAVRMCYNSHSSESLKGTLYSDRRGVAQLGLAHLLGVQGVGGSNPLAPTI